MFKYATRVPVLQKKQNIPSDFDNSLIIEKGNHVIQKTLEQ